MWQFSKWHRNPRNHSKVPYTILKNTEISLFAFFVFFRNLKKLNFKIFEIFQKLNFKMFVKTYENLDSSALYMLKVDKESVYVVYNSNIDKEYEFTCQNTDNFTQKLSETLEKKESVGKLMHSCIKQGELVAVTK